ncbi:sensor domain-containing diguanylate cyclase [Neptuniibacter caesariensis]|uniref:diguanylate cyclase n=1 Tax=Neptuniibacter caesariensis TaxID=207954 RepID=A0A7U8C6S8_NEPCE|nr:sensor domain-containing diguanylate cyclase [Neptuniibacter caesariensis]EAR61284.1 GGDEF family protein [Oceanospirillum sp. MED92] [Neptuniibacter caesariensis]
MLDSQTCISRKKPNSLDLDKWQRTVDLMAELYHSACGTIVQFRQGEFNAVRASLNEDNFLQQDSSWPWEMKSFCRKIIETGKGLYVNDPANDAQWSDADPVCKGPVRSYLGLPIYWPDGNLFGTICVIDTKKTDYDEPFLKLLEQFRDLINADLKMVYQYEELKSLALTDELTGINNRRGFNHLAEQRLKDAHRFEKLIGIVFIDIDNMKITNDEHGHKAGDTCLTTVSDLLSMTSRDSDIIARVGGDEFLVMLLVEDESDIENFCSRLSEKFDQTARNKTFLEKTSLSFGHVIAHPKQNISLVSLIEQADKNMYTHKRAKE